MKGCGACCKLGDFDEEVIGDMLQKEEDVVEYLGMIGEDGWCKWLDTSTRQCTKYDERPRFCRATPEVFEELYHVDEADFDTFAISCCHIHISNVFGEASQEAMRYETLTKVPFGHTQQCEGE